MIKKLLNKNSLTFWIFVGLFVGILFGHFAPTEWAISLKPIGKLFIRLIKMIVSPLIFSSLVVGLAGAGSKNIGRLLIKSLIWFWCATSIAIVIGLATANFFKPGVGAVQNTTAVLELAKSQPKTIIEQVVPESIFQAMAENSVLQIVFFAILFGMALSSLGERGRPVVEFFETITNVMFKVTEYIMGFAPFGVACAMAATVGANGSAILITLAKLVGSLYFALFVFVVLLLFFSKLILKIKVWKVLGELKEPLLIAFSTTSSESALPKAMKSMERLGVPDRIVSFVIPAGYSFNLDGTTLYLALASIFIAQAAGIEMSTSQQVVMMLTLLVTSKGVAAVPRASLVVLAATCAQFNLPVEWIATILGVDAIMDMGRTTVNVLGNCIASAAVAKWEKLLPADAPIVSNEKW